MLFLASCAAFCRSAKPGSLNPLIDGPCRFRVRCEVIGSAGAASAIAAARRIGERVQPARAGTRSIIGQPARCRAKTDASAAHQRGAEPPHVVLQVPEGPVVTSRPQNRARRGVANGRVLMGDHFALPPAIPERVHARPPEIGISAEQFAVAGTPLARPLTPSPIEYGSSTARSSCSASPARPARCRFQVGTVPDPRSDRHRAIGPCLPGLEASQQRLGGNATNVQLANRSATAVDPDHGAARPCRRRRPCRPPGGSAIRGDLPGELCFSL